MRILLLHNRYQLAGGEDNVVLAEQKLLQENGHEVHLIEADNGDIQNTWDQIKAALSVIYSWTSKQRVKRAIARFQPDLVHVHNFFPLLSPSVYDACKEAHIPVVQTLHNYRLLCPKATLFRDGQICEMCVDKAIPWPAVQHHCYRDSHLQSAAIATMLTWHQMQHTWQESVDAYIVFSQFQKEKMIAGGLPAPKIYLKPNFVEAPLDAEALPARENYFLFVGRLSEEKGCSVLIDAFIRSGIQVPLKIVGDGPLKATLQQQVKAAGYQHLIEFCGFCNPDVVRRLMLRAQLLVFPSIWYEGFPLTLLEAFSCRLPVLVPKLGGLPEIVEAGVSGLHFEAGNATDLAAKLRWLMEHPEVRQTLGHNAHHIFRRKYQAKTNYEQLMEIYQAVLGKQAAASAVKFSRETLNV